MNLAFDRSTIETGGLPGFTFYPHIGSVRIDGPANGKDATDSPSRARIFVCHPAKPSDEEPCARKIAATLARRAYRGYATPQHVDDLMKFYTLGRRNGGSFDNGIEAVVQRVLADPKFLFRIGVDAGEPGSRARPITSAIWISPRGCRSSCGAASPTTRCCSWPMPASSAIRACCKQQVERMLEDPKAAALTKNFAGQWLGLRVAGGRPAGRGPVPGLRRQPAPGLPPGSGDAVHEPAHGGPQRPRPDRRRTTPSSTAGWPSSTAFPVSRAAISVA